jgi:protein required for attachment to host cells
MNTPKTLIIISDSKDCRFYEAVGFKIKKLIKHLSFDDMFSSHKKQLARMGLYRKGSSPASLFDPHSDPKELDRKDFCAAVIKELNALDTGKEFSKIILAADPKTLGELRSDMSKAHQQKVAKEIHKDLIHLNQQELEDFLKEH